MYYKYICRHLKVTLARDISELQVRPDWMMLSMFSPSIKYPYLLSQYISCHEKYTSIDTPPCPSHPPTQLPRVSPEYATLGQSWTRGYQICRYICPIFEVFCHHTGRMNIFSARGVKIDHEKIDKINDPVGYWAYCQSFENRYLSKTILDVFECFSFQRESKIGCRLRYRTKSFPLTLKTCKQA